MTLRSAPRRALLAVALLASLASPAPTPETTQAPLWEGEAYASSGAPIAVAEGSPLVQDFEASFTVPRGGSGGMSSKLQVLVSTSVHAPATLSATVYDADGAELAAGEAIDDGSGQDPASGFVEFAARGLLDACVPGERCVVPFTLEVAVQGEPLSVYWEAYLSARDAKVGPEQEWVEMLLVPVGG